MGATNIADARMLVPYAVSGQNHKLHVFCKNPAIVGGNYMIDDRAGGTNTLLWTSCAEKLIETMNAVAPSTQTYGSVELQLLQNKSWVTVDAHAFSGTVTGSTVRYATQLTITLRTQGGYRTKWVQLETVEGADQVKIISVTGGDAAMDGLISFLDGTRGDTYDPFKWLVGMDNEFLTNTPFVSATFSLNRKIRRARGMA